MASLLERHGVTAEHQQEMGAVVALAAIMDSVLDIAIRHLLQLDKPSGLAITASMQTANKIHLLRTIGELRIDDPATKENFDKAVNAVASAAGKRHDIAHKAAMFLAETGQITLVGWSARSEVKRHEVPITLNWLRATAAEIERAALGLGAFLQTLEAVPSTPGPGSS